ncbi:MAG: PD40 domain-containing protein, partial [bacterium]
GEFVNTSGYDYCPFVTSDGKYFFFSKNNDLYWVDAKFIEALKPDDIY